MKRHPSLHGLSADHHRELVQARRLRRAAEGEAAARLATAATYVEIFFAETVLHFRREEELLFPLYALHAGSTPVLQRVLREHMELHGLARTLRAEVVGGVVSAETVRALGALLHDHVRVEERELFEHLQRVVPAEELEALGARLGT